MDVDAVITANMEKLVLQMDTQYCFQWGAVKCSGFMIVNLHKLQQVWDSAYTIDFSNASEAYEQGFTDQIVFTAIHDKFPHLVGKLSKEYDLNVANGVWRDAHSFAKTYSELGMIHYNGGGSSKDPYFNHMYFVNPKFMHEIGMPHYYVHFPWDWARSFSFSHTIPGRQFPLVLRHKNQTSIGPH
jgi:hypothetical protein